MPSAFLSFRDVAVLFDGAAKPVFDRAAFSLGPGWTGVVGANGAGKTTLLRLALGELVPTHGRVLAPSPVWSCPQRTDLEPDGLPALFLTDDAEALRIRQMLGLRPDWPDRWPTLSHGERKRAQLAVALAAGPALLAVDEPTNHLDTEARERVARALAAFSGIGLLVSHDRALLDRLCANCLFLEDGRVTVRPGGYSEGRREAAREAEEMRRRRASADRAVTRLASEQVTRRNQTAAGERARSKKGLGRHDHDAKARVDAARVSDSGSGQRLRQLDGRLRRAIEERESLALSRRFTLGIALEGETSRRKFLLSLAPGAVDLGGGQVLACPALTLRPDDRVGIEGPNGCGKSTLVRYMVSALEANGVRAVYVPQEIDARTGRDRLERVRSLSPDRLGRAMTLVRRLGSDPARLLESAEPSPGEVRKLLLAEAIGMTPNIVVLDEPTNHLDLPSIECLEDALDGFAGALVMVSHDRGFLDRLARRRWLVTSGGAGRWVLSG